MQFALIVPMHECCNAIMLFVIMINEWIPGRSTARVAFMHHADPFGEYQSCWISIQFECSTDKLLTQIASMLHVDKGHGALKYCETIK